MKSSLTPSVRNEVGKLLKQRILDEDGLTNKLHIKFASHIIVNNIEFIVSVDDTREIHFVFGGSFIGRKLQHELFEFCAMQFERCLLCGCQHDEFVG